MLQWVDAIPSATEWVKSDECRRAVHREALVTWEAQWSLSGAGVLIGPFGELLHREIRKRFAPGPPAINDSGVESGPSARHLQLMRSVRGDWHAMRRIVEPWAMIHRAPASISGTSTESPAWNYLRQWSLLDSTLQHKLQWTLALRGCPVRLSWVPVDRTMQRFYAPTLAVVPPERVTAIAHPNNPMFPIAVIEHPESPRDLVKLWDLSDASKPSFSGWTDVGAIVSKKSKGCKWVMEGQAYPWRWRNRPILPWVMYQGDYSAQALLPASNALTNDTIVKILRDAWLDWIQFVGSFDRAVVLSDVPLVGFEQALIDPSNVMNLYPESPDAVGSKSTSIDLKIVPNASQTVERLRKIEASITAQMVQRYHSSFRAESSGSPESGVALSLRMDGQHQERQQQETAHRPRDLQLLRVLISGWNHLVASGMLRGTLDAEASGESSVWIDPTLPEPTLDLLIPESDDLSIEYPVVWRPEEKREILAAISDAVQRGLDSRVSYYLAATDTPDTPSARRAALTLLETRALEEIHTLRLGLGVSRDALYQTPPVVQGVAEYPEYLSESSAAWVAVASEEAQEALRAISLQALPEDVVVAGLTSVAVATGVEVAHALRVWREAQESWMLRHAAGVTSEAWAAGCVRRYVVDQVRGRGGEAMGARVEEVSSETGINPSP